MFHPLSRLSVIAVALLAISQKAYGLSCHVCEYQQAMSSDSTITTALQTLNHGEQHCANGDTEQFLQECKEETHRCNLIDAIIYVELTLSYGGFGEQVVDYTLHNVQRTCVDPASTVNPVTGCQILDENSQFYRILNQQQEDIANMYRSSGLTAEYFLESSGEYCECDTDGCNHPLHELNPIEPSDSGPDIPDDTRRCLSCSALKFYSPVPDFDGSISSYNDGDVGCEEGTARVMRCDSGQHACVETISYVDVMITADSVTIPFGFVLVERGCADDSQVQSTNGACIDLSSHLNLDADVFNVLERVATDLNLDVRYERMTGRMCTCTTDGCNNNVIDTNWRENVSPFVPPTTPTTTTDAIRMCKRCFYSQFQSQDGAADSTYSVGLDTGETDCESGAVEGTEACEQHEHACYTEHVQLYGTHAGDGKLWSYTVTQRGCSLHNAPLQCVTQDTVHGMKRFAMDNIEYSSEDLVMDTAESFVQGCICETDGCNTKSYDPISVNPQERSQSEAQDGNHGSKMQANCVHVVIFLMLIYKWLMHFS